MCDAADTAPGAHEIVGVGIGGTKIASARVMAGAVMGVAPGPDALEVRVRLPAVVVSDGQAAT